MPIPNRDVRLNAIASCNGVTCGGCKPATPCRTVAVSSSDGNTGYVYTNDGLNPNNWTEHIIYDWSSGQPYNRHLVDVLCFGDFIMVLAENPLPGGLDYPFMYSIDSGDSWNVPLIQPGVFNLNPPHVIDAIDPTRIIAAGDGGYIYITTNQGITWEAVTNGALANDAIYHLMICRQNPNIVYACNIGGDILKSEDYGDHWWLVNNVGDNIAALWVINSNDILIAGVTGSLYQSTDGGTTLTLQIMPSDYTPDMNITALHCCNCGDAFGAGTCIMATQDSVTDVNRIYRNAGWSSGQWETVRGADDLLHPIRDFTCCDTNHIVGVGGPQPGGGPYSNTESIIVVLS